MAVAHANPALNPEHENRDAEAGTDTALATVK
jgi:hypothetical protein